MLRKAAVALCVAWALLSPHAAAADDAPPAVTRWVPRDAVLVVEVNQPGALLDLLLDPRVISAVTSLPAYQQKASGPEFQQFLGLIRYLEATLGTDWRSGVRTLTGGGVTLAAWPVDQNVLAIDSEDAQMLEKLHEIFLGFARTEAANRSQPDRTASEQYKGVTGWTFNGQEAHAIVGGRLLMAKGQQALKAVLDLRAGPEAQSLASAANYQAAKQAAGPDAVALAFVNLEALKQYPPVQRALSQTQNPMASLLLAGIQETLRGSSWVALAVGVQGDTLTFEMLADGKAADPSGPAGFACPASPDEGVLPNLQVPRRIAAASFYRDLRAFYAAKDNLFPQRTAGLIFFENMMGIYFSGRDLTDEVMAELRPEVRLVVAEQEYDPAVGIPQTKIPAFAAVFRMRHPDTFAQVMEEAWQKAIGMVNFTRGQQALPGLIIDRPVHRGVKFTIAYFPAGEQKDKEAVDQRFNFQPALATVGDHLILSSTEALARDLIDALQDADASPIPRVHSLVEIDAARVASALSANRENLVRQNMLEKGNTRDQAETELGSVLAVLERMGQATLDVGSANGRPAADLELRLDLPAVVPTGMPQ